MSADTLHVHVSSLIHSISFHYYYYYYSILCSIYRCHTFALGPDISSELMAGIASETGGYYSIIDEESRLQTKVGKCPPTCN